jgi:hypothetical protein
MDEKTARQDELRRRFAPAKPQPVEVAAIPHVEPPPPKPTAPPSSRRRDYKGERRRLNLRLPETLTDDLAVLCMASGVDKNAFCEEVLGTAIKKQLEKVRQRYKPEEWEGILRCVREGKGL